MYLLGEPEMTNPVVFRKGKLVYLRPFHSSDTETLTIWMNDPEITRFLGRVFPVTLTGEQEWIANQSKDEKQAVFAIVTVDGDRFIGTIGLHGIDLINRTATTGTVIGEKEYWSKGYGTEAKMLLLDFAFNGLDLHSIDSNVLAFNGRSLAYGSKCGYVEVGRIPEWIRKGAVRYDEVILVVTQERWRPLWEKYTEQKDNE